MDFSGYRAITINTILISIKVVLINGATGAERTHLRGDHTDKGRERVLDGHIQTQTGTNN